MRNNQKIKVSCKERKNFLKKMTHLLEKYELIDISSDSEDETEASERSSTPLPSGSLPNIRVILNVSNSSARAVADEEEYFDVSADSLEADCKRMRLSSSFESLESGELNNASPKSEYSSMKESPDSPDEQEEDDNNRTLKCSWWKAIVHQAHNRSRAALSTNIWRKSAGKRTIFLFSRHPQAH